MADGEFGRRHGAWLSGLAARVSASQSRGRTGRVRAVRCEPALPTQIGLPNLHLHDLRATGNTLAAQSGASLRDLMTREGPDRALADRR